MKGIIFNLFEDFVIHQYDYAAYQDIISACSLKTSGEFIGPGTYLDEDFMEIVSKAVHKTKIPTPELLKAFGKFCFPVYSKKFPQFITPHKTLKSFLMSLDSLHYIEVKKLYQDARPPAFRCNDSGPDTLSMEYESPRKMCPMMEGLLEGAAEYFQTSVNHHHTRCMLKGAPSCKFEMSFSQINRKAA